MVFPATKRQILIIDADNQFTKNLVHILEEHGLDTIVAATAKDALHKASILDLDMIIIGDNIPDANSINFCERLKQGTETEFIPIIMISANCQSKQKVMCYHLGADECMDKDFEMEELLARMEAIWRRGNAASKGRLEERQRKIIQELTFIIEKEMVEPHFQPIYLLKPFQLFGIEVLSRPAKGLLLTNAEELFKAALKYDLYYPLEMMCWNKAVRVVTGCTRNENVFFNCSPYIVENSKFPKVKEVFQRNRMPFDKIVLEITERSSITEHDRFYDRLAAYREEGFSFAVDDVGSGYASLESIVAAKPEMVKIDANIVRDLHMDSVKRSIMKFMVAFCKENNILSIAEGVETREEMEAVISLGVDAVQGYYFFKPTAELNLQRMKDVCVAHGESLSFNKF